MQPEQIPEPWASFLSQVDDHLREDVELHCLGGFVITMLYGLARSTADVDVLPVTKKGRRHVRGNPGCHGDSIFRL